MGDLLNNEIGVRVSPSMLHFIDALVGESYQANLIVQNISPVVKNITIKGPIDPQFTLIAKQPKSPIAPGLHVTATVKYQPMEKEDACDRLIVVVDKDSIEVPLIGFLPSCFLMIDSEVNFGNIIANSKVICKEIAIRNYGSSPGNFKIKYTGDLPISFEPMNGTIKAKSSSVIKAELCADKPRVIDEIATVKLQGCSAKTMLSIKGNVVTQELELLDTSSKPLQCIHFGSVYFGTTKTHKAFVYNNSPETMNWVAVLDDKAPGVEMGTDLRKSTDAALQTLNFRKMEMEMDITTIISCLPNQGRLPPFQKTKVTLCFSPQKDESNVSKIPSQKDYALFIRFEPVGSKDGFLLADHITDSKEKKKHVELGVIGSGHPVALTLNPGPVYNFKECLIGEQKTISCSLNNESEFLPVTFSFQKLPHFNISPAKGKIMPGHSQEVLFTFAPHQVGTFKVNHMIDILGHTTEDNSPPLKVKAFQQKILTFTGSCKSVPKKIVMKINPGISPIVSNNTVQFVPAKSEETGPYTGSARVAVLNAAKTQIHDHQTKSDKDALIAFPNDRPASIRPEDPYKKYRTIFTKTERYNYVDPEYAYTEEEKRLIKSHQDYYKNYINGFRERRINERKAREFAELNNEVEIGIKPASGLQPPKLSSSEHVVEQDLKRTQSVKGHLLTTHQLAAEESRSLVRQINDGLNAIPCTTQEKEQCSLTLTPLQLHQIVIGPSIIDFGEVCVRSTSVKKMNIINSLPLYIWVQIETEFEELQQTSPLSHVVPPMSKTEVPVVFETNSLGKFKKSITYTVNSQHIGYVLVTAEVVPIALELSTNELILRPNCNFLAESGFRSSITLCNRRNHPAEFNWKPVMTKQGIAFSIRPAKGIVDAYKDLDCEVVWHSQFSSPEVGEFDLCVQHGNTLKLKCIAELGPTSVQFTDQSVPFNEASLGLPIYKTAVLQNTGLNHAYFQVEDVCPLPGMSITPYHGVVPVGGYTTLTIFFIPQTVMKFDTTIEVSVCNTNKLKLRIGGSVAPPKVHISPKSILFPGVYANSIQSIPFVLENKGEARAKVHFDFSKYRDFYVKFKEQSVVYMDPSAPQFYSVDLEKEEKLDGALYFHPKAVAAYGFDLPINTIFTGDVTYTDTSAPPTPTNTCSHTPTKSISHTSMNSISHTATNSISRTSTSSASHAPTNSTSHSSASTSYVTSNSSEKRLLVRRPRTGKLLNPSCKVTATVLKQALMFSTHKLEFELPSGFIDLGIADGTLHSQVWIKTLDLTNVSKETITWKLSLDQAGDVVEDGIYRFSKSSGMLQPGQMNTITVHFCPPGPGIYDAEIPMILNDNSDDSFMPLYLSGCVRMPKLVFDPPFLILTPVPLDAKAQNIVNITAIDFSSDSALKVKIPEVQLDNGTPATLFSVIFPNGQTISSSKDNNEGFVCQIHFRSSSPVSCLVDIMFIDENNNQFPLQVAAVAENCILSVYPYLAYHQTDQQVILKTGHNGSNGKGNSTGDALLHPLYVPEVSSQCTSFSSLAAFTNSTYEESIPGEDKERIHVNDEVLYKRKKDKFELSFYPEDNTNEWVFFQKVSAAVQNWFSFFGWPDGVNPISIPHSFYSNGLCQIPLSKSGVNAKKTGNLGKQTKTIYDLLFYLSGQMLPGTTTASQSLPSNPADKVLQLHWQQATLLTFLKNQGASLPHVKPEYLFDPLDYERWIQVQVQLKQLAKTSKKDLHEFAENDLLVIDNVTFQSVSKRVWTDVLLQTYKVLILSRVSATGNNETNDTKSMPKISSEPLSSNIYSPPERILLTWLNERYEKMRKTVWDNCQKGDVPNTRWIVNFDKDLLDGLVLAALLASYCPFLISTHFIRMNTNPETQEECLHNSLILVNAFRTINLDIDIQATDICDPNPVTMLMLCVYLHENLPFYPPKKSVEFEGTLHDTVSREISLKNPSSKTLVYKATIVGRESADFSLPNGNIITIVPKGRISVKLTYTSRFLHPAEATLLLVSSPNGKSGTTIVFSLKSTVTKLPHVKICKYQAPCYEVKNINLPIENYYKSSGKFRVILVESASYLSSPDHLKEINQMMSEKAHSTSSMKNKIASVICNTNNEVSPPGQAKQSSLLPQFFCPVSSLALEECSSVSLEMNFLPFYIGTCYCTIIFSNEVIGDFVHVIEGTGNMPLPSPFLPLESPNVLPSIPAVTGKSKNHIRLKCAHNDILRENLKISLVNEAKEKALAVAAQLQMTDLEYTQRKVTGTLESSSIRVAMAALEQNTVKPPSASSFTNKTNVIEYDVEISTPHQIEIPKKICIPLPTKSRGNFLNKQDIENEVSIPIKFGPKNPGCYLCHIFLRSSLDVRLYVIECVVNSTRIETELEFTTHAWDAVVQDIPITNVTEHEWKLQAVLTGDFFYGPPFLTIPPGETSQYSLMFKPLYQYLSKGRLILQNETDGTEHIFGLKGIGQEPLALDHIVIDCQVRQITQKILMVPNYTNGTLTYKVSSDIPYVSGPNTITVTPGTYSFYKMKISPWKHGLFEGVISFVADDFEQQQFQHGISPDDTDGVHTHHKLIAEEVQAVDVSSPGKKIAPYKVWFSLELNSKSAPPERTINVTCPVLGTRGIEIPISNPTHKELHVNVLVDGAGLTGENIFTLQAKETLPYTVNYSPTKKGISLGRVIFQSDVFEEFWYKLLLEAVQPLPTTLPEVHCEFGKWTRCFIKLFNPTDEILELEPANNNTENFLVEVDPKSTISLSPHTAAEVPVQFCPSDIGKGNHTASISFTNPQLGEWVFYVSGQGILPQPMESASISAVVGSVSSMVISFKNPSAEHVLIDVILTDQEQTMHRLSASVLRHSINKESAFCLPLKQTQGIPLAPKEKLDIPVSFAPDTMKLYESLVVVHMVKATGNSWAQDHCERTKSDLKSVTKTESGAISGIRWIYPIHGIPEAQPSSTTPAIVSCEARTRTEERVEVLLTGVVPGQSGIPTEKTNQIQEEVQISNGLRTTDEFLYEITYESEDVKAQLESSLGIRLIHKERDAPTGIVTLIFNIIFAPPKPMSHSATIKVKCATGGIWKFPIQFVATEPNVDDVIEIKAVGLNKESFVGFRLTSKTRYQEPFSAYFLPGSDMEFSVLPHSGELRPVGSTGTLIIVGFKPSMYSKKQKATLIIKTPTMQWNYEVKGKTPKPTSLSEVPSKIFSSGFKPPTTTKKRNFIQDNLKLISTAVSSPIKGASLVLRT